MARSFGSTTAGLTENIPASLLGWNSDTTISAWAYVNVNSTAVNGHRCGMQSVGAPRGLYLQAYGTSGTSTDWGGVVAGVNYVTAGETLALNQWHHLAFVHNSGTGNQFVYRAGALKNSASLGGYIACIAGDLASVVHQDAGSNYFADLAIWKAMLSAPEISALANGIRPKRIRTPSLAVWIPMDGIESSESDLAGNGLSATLAGTTAFVSGPPFDPQTSRWPQPAPFVPQVSVAYQRAQQILMTGP